MRDVMFTHSHAYERDILRQILFVVNVVRPRMSQWVLDYLVTFKRVSFDVDPGSGLSSQSTLTLSS